MLEQYVDGLFGSLIVRALPGAPEAMPAHTDEVTLLLADFYSLPAHALLAAYYLTPDSGGNEPVPDAVTVNGQFSAALSPAAPPEQQLFVGLASRTGKTLFHVIAANAFSMFRVSIDGVNLQLVEVDATAVHPLTVPNVVLNVAQRASFVVDWSTLPAAFAAHSSVFLRIEVMVDMDPFDVTDITAYPAYTQALQNWAPLDANFVGVLQFSPVAAGRVPPTYSASAAPPAAAPAIVNTGMYASTDVSNLDTNLLDARPILAIPMPPPTHQMYLEIAFYPDDLGINRAHFNDISHTHDMSLGMLPALYKHTGAFASSVGAAEAPAALTLLAAAPPGYGAGAAPPAAAVPYSPDAHYVLPPSGVIVVFINNTDGGEHPIHVHGHSFWVISSSARPDAEAAFASNIARRDVVSVEAGGWVKIAFVADNPGVWALHCHIDWHVAAGLMIEMFEALPSLGGLQVPPQHEASCGIVPSMHMQAPPAGGVAAAGGAAAAAPDTSNAAAVAGLAAALGVVLAAVLVAAVMVVLRRGGGGERAGDASDAQDDLAKKPPPALTVRNIVQAPAAQLPLPAPAPVVAAQPVAMPPPAQLPPPPPPPAATTAVRSPTQQLPLPPVAAK